MGGIGNGLKTFFVFLSRNKGKIALIPLIALAWIPFLFPYSDLRSIVATKLSTALGEGTAIDFQHASLAVGFPIAFEVENFEFDGAGLPSIAADRLIARPSLSSILTRSPAGSVEAEGLFKGNVTASLSPGAKLKAGGLRQDIKADIAGLQLSLLTDALRRVGMMSFNVQGTLDTNATMSIDPDFADQPQADLFVQGKTISIPSVSIPIPNMGPVLTPSLQLGRVDFKGKLNDGKIQIEDFSFGQGKDALSGRVRGEFALTLLKEEQRLRASPGAFDLKVELNVSKPLMDAMSKSGVALALLIVEKYKTVSGDTLKYAFRVRAPAFGAPPTFEAIQ